MKIYTCAQMREREQAAAANGTPLLQLMENAGTAAAQNLMHRLPAAGCALMVCGKGNNGGDALVMARILAAQGWQSDIAFILGDTLSDLAETNRKRLSGIGGIRFIPENALSGSLKSRHYTVIVDAVFGTGFSGSLPEAAARTMRLLNQNTGSLKTALDIPTGLNGDTGEAAADSFRADLTYAFAALKPAHLSENGKALCGEIQCLNIGID